MTQERKNYPRVKAAHAALFLTSVYPVLRLASTIDLNLGGVRIATPCCLMIDQMIDLTIAIAGRIITCKGRVVSVLLDADEPMVRVRFGVIPEEHRLYLEGHISSLLEQRNEVVWFQLS